jgi:hypothetical protein
MTVARVCTMFEGWNVFLQFVRPSARTAVRRLVRACPRIPLTPDGESMKTYATRRSVVAMTALACAFLPAPQPAAADVNFRLVAATGDPAPGGGTFDRFSAALINEAGHVAFEGRAAASTDWGIFTAADGTLYPIVRPGDDVRGLAGYHHVGLKGPGLNRGLHGFNNNGEVAWHSLIADSSAMPTDAIFVGDRDRTDLVLWQGTPVQGYPGRTYDQPAASFYPVALGGAGQIAVLGVSPDGTGHAFDMYRFDRSTQQLHPLNLPAILRSISTPAANRVGQIALTTGSPYDFVWRGNPGGQGVVLAGDPPDGPEVPLPGGGSYRGAGSAAINARGTVVFSGLEAGLESGQGVWLAPAGGAVQTVAHAGQPAPGIPGATWSGFTNAMRINDRGEIAFIATVFRPDLNATVEGVWAGSPSDLRLIALAGQAAPGTTNVFDDFLGTSLALNNNGQVAFSAGFPNIAVGNIDGIWASGPDGTLGLVAQLGQTLTADGRDFVMTALRLASGNGADGGNGGAFNDRGELVFTNGNPLATSAGQVFVAIVPEPTALGAALAFLAVVQSRRRPRRPHQG